MVASLTPKVMVDVSLAQRDLINKSQTNVTRLMMTPAATASALVLTVNIEKHCNSFSTFYVS